MSNRPPNAVTCFERPRKCEHFDDLDCTIAESMGDPEFAREWIRLQAQPPSRRVRAWRHNERAYGKAVAVKPAHRGRRHAW